MTMILTIEVDKEGVMRLVNIMGADSIELPPYLKTASANAPREPETAPEPAPVNDSEPVKLDPKDPEFQAKKMELKKKGFRYLGKYQAWYPPRRENNAKSEKQQESHHQFENWWGSAKSVGLLKDDPDFNEKKAALKRAGFKWNKVLSLWENPTQQ